MKRIIFISLTLTAILTAVSCRKERVGSSEPEDGGLKLSFVCGDQSTKGETMPGEDEYHENTITTIDWFLYPEGQTDRNAYLKGRVTMSGRTSFNVLVNTSQLQALFAGAGQGNHCDVYAIANYPGPVTDFNAASDTTSLRNLAVSNFFRSATVQTDFVMSGHTKAEIIDKNKTKAAEGTVNLKRAASKVTFECRIADHVDITNYIYSGGEVVGTTTTRWVPIYSGIGAYLVNGYAKGKVGGDSVEVDEGYLYRYDQRAMTDADADDWYTCDPFYSYPQTWNDGDEREPFIKLVVPWAYLNAQGQEAGQKQFYYKVPCPGLKMDANTWYHIKLDVAILGGDDFEAMLEVSGQYYVVSWNTKTMVQADAEIKDARYISAPLRTYDMYNVADLNVLITSSNESELNLKSVYYYNFVTGQNTDYTTTARNNNWIVYNDDTRTFTINHPLNNDINSNNFDSSPYIFTFEIRHSGTADDHKYTTGDIVVTQYPAMYIDELQSNKYVFINGYANQASSEVTAYDDSSNSLSVLVTRNSINDSGTNTNSHMYRIHVTSVAGLDYTIGDTRLWSDHNVTTLNSIGDDYMETSAINEDMIAPEFMVASSAGKSQSMEYKYAVTRCAAYQENGYPAGRWRLPTKAEIMFLIQLSEQGKIPTLFTPDDKLNDGAYWCSSGVVYPIEDGNNKYVTYLDFDEASQYHNNTNWVRCIYDSWYWGDDNVQGYLTTWGGYHTTSQPVN